MPAYLLTFSTRLIQALRAPGMALRGALKGAAQRLTADGEALMRGGIKNVGETRDHIG